MLEKNDDNTSSSEDEISKDALREATDHQFLKEIYFSEKKSIEWKVSQELNKHATGIQTKNITNAKSLRQESQQNYKFENFGVSPSFQIYVAKKLDEILERAIRLKNKADHSLLNEKKTEPRNDSGIKLLNNSAEFLTTEEECHKQTKPKRFKICKGKIDEDMNLLKCKEAAVHSDWVLSKIDTKHWTSKQIDSEFKYKKLKNGVIVEKI